MFDPVVNEKDAYNYPIEYKGGVRSNLKALIGAYFYFLVF